MTDTTGENLPELPKDLEPFLDKPYGGLFGDNARTRIIEEIIADPHRYYRPRYFEELTGASAPTVRKILNSLTKLGLLEKDTSDRQHPIYLVNLNSKKVTALTFLAYASLDDRDGSNCMDDAILDYCARVLRPKKQPLGVSTELEYEIGEGKDNEEYEYSSKSTTLDRK
ncbi:TPA: hypothetical protein HA351_04450 [Methanosarcinaceae archaeon]|nr:hypothetical protein [Methanosarcinaceae archaeon]